MKKLILMLVVVFMLVGCSGGGGSSGEVFNFNYEELLGTWHTRYNNSEVIKFETETTGIIYNTSNNNIAFEYKIIDDEILNIKYKDENDNQVDKNVNYRINGTSLVISESGGAYYYNKISNFELDVNIIGSWFKSYIAGYTLVGYVSYTFNEDGTGVFLLAATGVDTVIRNFKYQTIDNEVILFEEELNGKISRSSDCYDISYNDLRMGDFHEKDESDTVYEKIEE